MFASFVAAFAAVSCDKPDNGGGEPENKDFAVSILNLSQGAVDIKISPEDNELTYYFGIEEKLVYESEYKTPEALCGRDLDRIHSLAEAEDIPLDQFLLEALIRGEKIWTYTGLTPKTDYIFYVYGLSTECEILTEVTFFNFTTPEVSFTDTYFEIEAGDITPTSFTLNIVPGDKTVSYYYDILLPANYEEYCGSDPANVPDFVESYLAALKEEEQFASLTMPQFIDAITVRGDHSDDSFENLLPEATYYAFAVGVANDGSVITEASVEEIHTTESPKNVWDVVLNEASDVSDTYCRATVYAEQKEAFAVMFELAEYFGETDTDADIINALYEANRQNISQYLHAEMASVEFDRLIPDDDYLMLIFACYPDGTPKTEAGKVNLLKVPVHTKPAAQISARFSMSVSSIAQTTAVVKVDVDKVDGDKETFLFNVAEKSVYDGWVADASKSLDEHMKAGMNAFIDTKLDAYNAGHPGVNMTRKEFLSRNLLDGAGVASYYDVDGLESETGYVVYLAGMKADGTFTTPFVTESFRTLGAQESQAKMEEVEVKCFEGTTAGTDRYQLWAYPGPGSKLQHFYGKAFAGTDEWTGKTAGEVLALLQAEPQYPVYHTFHLSDVEWGSTIYFYAVAYDNADVPSKVYRLVHKTPDGVSGTTQADLNTGSVHLYKESELPTL